MPSLLLPHLHRSFLSRLTLSACVPTVLSYSSTGISTCCPSATLLCLALGPDLPRADQLYPGILGYSAWRIPTSISLLIPAFSLLIPPPPLPGAASRALRMLPYRCAAAHPAASAACFSPGHFRRGDSRPVGCYALFERVAASGPTSWLSVNPHILSHLTRTLGPQPAVWAVSLSAARLISCSLTPARRRCGIRSLIFSGRL